MQLVVAQLLRVQFLIALATLILSLLSPYAHLATSIAAGALVSCMSTMVVWMLVRRMPKVLRPKSFYFLMCLCEIMKWLAVIVLMVIFLKKQLAPLGLILGFVSNYIGGYWSMLKLK